MNKHTHASGVATPTTNPQVSHLSSWFATQPTSLEVAIKFVVQHLQSHPHAATAVGGTVHGAASSALMQLSFPCRSILCHAEVMHWYALLLAWPACLEGSLLPNRDSTAAPIYRRHFSRTHPSRLVGFLFVVCICIPTTAQDCVGGRRDSMHESARL